MNAVPRAEPAGAKPASRSESLEEDSVKLRPEENALYEALVKGEDRAIYEMTRLYRPIAGAVAPWLPAHAADDVFQESLIKAWNRRRQFDPRKGSFRSWFFAIYRNLAVDVLRRLGRRQAREQRRVSLRSSAAFREARAAIAALLRDQPASLSRLKWSIVLADLDAFPDTVAPAALAELLGSTEASIRAQRSKAYARLVELGLPDMRELRRADPQQAQGEDS